MNKSLKTRYLETRTITDRSGVNEITTIIQRIVDLLLKEDEKAPEGLRQRYTHSLCTATTNHLDQIDQSGILGRLKAARDENIHRNEDSEDIFAAAACVGHTSLLKRLLKSGAKIDARSHYFGGALRGAAFGGHKETVLLLLENGVNVDADKVRFPPIPLLWFEDWQQTALQAAALAGHEHVARLLLEPKYHVGTSREYEQAILDAAQGGHSSLMQSLRDIIFDNRREPPYIQEYILHTASKYGHAQIVRTMIEAGTEVDCGARRSHSPLALAASRGFDEIVQILLEKGASPDGPESPILETTTPLCEAVKGGYERATRTLLHHGADINAGFPSPLFIAAKSGHDHLVCILRQRGAFYNPSWNKRFRRI